jgi:hypothetical protein
MSLGWKIYENGLRSFPMTGFITGNVESSGSAAESSLCTRENKKLSALLFFQFIYTKVGVEQVRHFST